jgi:hypothetical protein
MHNNSIELPIVLQYSASQGTIGYSNDEFGGEMSPLRDRVIYSICLLGVGY